MSLPTQPHSRRRRLRRVALASTAAGAMVVAPLLAVGTPAQAATGKTWNRLAQCESSGRWHINTGNGYYGGLQFSASTWRAFGGTKYAARADLATRMQQILTAEKVLDVQGWGAWPACSRKLGLTEADKKGDPRDDGKTKKKKKDKKKKKPPVVTKKAPPLPPMPKKSPKKAPKKTPSPSKCVGGDGYTEYTVKSGDTLSRIAAKKHVAGGWKAVYKRNACRIDNPNAIYVGQRLDVR